MPGPLKRRKSPDRFRGINEGMPKLHGEVVGEGQLEAINYFLQGNTKSDIAKKVEVNRSTIITWSKQNWWIKEVERHLGETQKEYHVALRNMGNKAVKGLERVVDSTDPKSHGAIVNANKLLAEVGKDPLIDRKGAQLNVNTNIISGKTVLNLDKLGELTQEELTRILLGDGAIPDKVKIINPDDGV